MEWHPAGWSVCLPLLIFPCTIKPRSSLLALPHPGGPGKNGHKTLLCVCVCVCVCLLYFFYSYTVTMSSQKHYIKDKIRSSEYHNRPCYHLTCQIQNHSKEPKALIQQIHSSITRLLREQAELIMPASEQCFLWRYTLEWQTGTNLMLQGNLVKNNLRHAALVLV